MLPQAERTATMCLVVLRATPWRTVMPVHHGVAPRSTSYEVSRTFSVFAGLLSWPQILAPLFVGV
jgi:hypothetical protein